MTPEQFRDAMKAIKEANDIENGHVKADKLLCEVLEQIGYAEGVKVFREMIKWYS